MFPFSCFLFPRSLCVCLYGCQFEDKYRDIFLPPAQQLHHSTQHSYTMIYPLPIHTCSPIPSLENLNSEEYVSMLFWNNLIIRHNITCTAIISQFDLCCTVTCFRHYTHISRLYTYSHKRNIQPYIVTYFKYKEP